MSLPKEYRWCIASSVAMLMIAALAEFVWTVVVCRLLEQDTIIGRRWVTTWIVGSFAILAAGVWLERLVSGFVFTRLFMRRHMVAVHYEDLGE